MLITRRSLFGMLTAPAVIRIADLMPVRQVVEVPELRPFIWKAPQAKLYVGDRLITDVVWSEVGVFQLPFAPARGEKISIVSEFYTGPNVYLSARA